MNKRNYQHHTEPDSAVFRHAKENNIPIPEIEILETNLSQELAQEREHYWVGVFSTEKWNILNKMKTGIGISSLGSVSKKWNTKEKVRTEALKYKNRSEFQKKSVGAYMAARKNNWLDDFEWLKPKSNYHPRHTKSKFF